MSLKTKVLPMLVLTATMGISACVAHVREPYGYYGGGYRHGYTRVYSHHPRHSVVYRDHDGRRHHDRDRWRRGDRYRDDRYRDNDRDNDGIHDRWDRHD